MMLLAAAALLGAGVAGTPSETPWYERYERGVALVQQGQGAEAEAELEQALAARGEEGLHLPTEGLHSVDYLPHLYLAIACHMEGHLAAARQHLADAESSGVAGRSEVGRPLLEAYRILLSSPAPEPPPKPRYQIYERRPTVMSDADYKRLEGQVLSGCHLSPDTPLASAPWYFHYELGMALVRGGDPQRALDAFIEAATRRPQPGHTARIYGMWFTDYFPYFQIARAHARLGNWECSADALALSKRLREVSERDRDFAELVALERETESHLKH